MPPRAIVAAARTMPAMRGGPNPSPAVRLNDVGTVRIHSRCLCTERDGRGRGEPAGYAAAVRTLHHRHRHILFSADPAAAAEGQAAESAAVRAEAGRQY